jgi:uncharacterized membrane protein (DUF4010 family)
MGPTVGVFEKLALALGLGLLIGLQRERAQKSLAGIRTFPLITVFGAVCALLGLWVVVAGLASVAALVVAGYVAETRRGAEQRGLTTEVSALLMFGVGAYLMLGETEIGVAVGGAVVLLLHWKGAMHGFVQRIGENDVTAIMRFALITLVILPVLPDETFGPYDVLNPKEIWLMVVLIVGINLGGYAGYRVLGSRGGAVVAGLLGGFISSTATTVSQARGGGAPALASLVILLASTVVFVRVLIEIAVAAPAHFAEIAPPVALVGAAFVAASVVVWVRVRSRPAEAPPPGNPAELKPALFFGAAYAVVLVATAAANEHFQAQGLYVVALVSGLTDMDAITLSTSRLSQAGRLAAGTAWRVILVAMLSNLVFKAAVVGVLGPRPLLLRILLLFGAAGGVTATALFALWP